MTTNRLILTLFILLVVAMAAFVLWTRYARPEPAALVPVEPTEERTVPVKLFAYDARRDTDASGTVLCSAKGLVPVVRNVPENDTVLASTLTLLFTDPLTEVERGQGLSTEFPLENVRLLRVAQEGDDITLEVRDPSHKTSGGSCRVSVMRAQIEATATQFDERAHVRFTPAGVFEP